MSANPKYFPEHLDLPLPTNHKTWHTERLCPPLLAYALGTDQALFIAQLHHWLQYEDFGVIKHGWHWIWNTEWEWQEQFPWWSEDKTGHIRRSLERAGYVVSNNFSRTPLNRTKYSTLDYYKIALETGWNPLGLDLNRSYPQPPQFVKGQRQRGRHISDDVELVYSDTEENPEPSQPDDSAKIQNVSRSEAKVHSGKNQLSTIYKKNSISTKKRTSRIKRESDLCESVIPEVNQDEDGSDPWLDVDNDSIVVAEQPLNHSSKPESLGRDKYSARAGQFVNSEQKNKYPKTKPVKQVDLDREPYEWEIALNRPYDVFLRWWADRKYVPQEGRWAADALGNAYSEFYNNPHKVTAVIFPQFLEFMQQVAENQNQARFAGLKVILPSCFKVLPIPTKENVQQLMANIQVLIDDDAQVALRQGIATPSCNQSISYEQAADTSIAPLPSLTPVEALPPANNPLTLEEQVQIKQIQWRNVPLLRGVITEWVNKTEAVVLGENGPELAPSIDPGDKEPKSPTKSPEPKDPAPNAPPAEASSSTSSAPRELRALTSQPLNPTTVERLNVNDDEGCQVLSSDLVTPASASTAQKTGLEPTVANSSGFNSTANEPDYSEYLEQPDPKDFTPPDSTAQKTSSEPTASTQNLAQGQTAYQTAAATDSPTGRAQDSPTRPAEHTAAQDDPASFDAPDPTTALLTPGQDTGQSAPSQTTVDQTANAASRASSNQEAEPTATRNQFAPVFKVDDRVFWVNAPPHWDSWGALIIRAIEGDHVLVDVSDIWILISELRHSE